MMTADQIRRLCEAGREAEFYNSWGYRRLTAEIRRERHAECHDCKEKGVLTKAVKTVNGGDRRLSVHHVNPIRLRPDLAYSRTYTDGDGVVRDNLILLCETCHGLRHGRAGPRPVSTVKPGFEEIW